MDTSRPVDRRRPWMLVGLGVVGVLTLVAWAVLVYASIGFGSDARSGESLGWAFLGLTAFGAVACLVMTLIVGARIVALLRGTAPVRTKGGGHRAAR